MGEGVQPSVDETLARLGVEELEERLEMSPLLAGGDLQEADRLTGGHCCTCKITPNPPEPDDPYPLPGPEG
jgi:hypothetical protein